MNKLRVGITMGDINGIGPELIIKTFSNELMYNHCIPIIYGSAKALSFHKNTLKNNQVHYQKIKDYDQIKDKQLNVVNCIDPDLRIEIGKETIDGGNAAINALKAALNDLKDNRFDILVTAPVNKKLISDYLNEHFSGQTEFITQYAGADESMMLLATDYLKVGLVTTHIPLEEVKSNLSTEGINKKLSLFNRALKEDYLINKPKIAVLSLNPHAGDNGLMGKEEIDIISPAIQKAYNNGIYAFGPYAADGFFGMGQFKAFDGVLAMYHDQGLVPFKTLAFEGVNFTTGLPIVRTSPDHGPAYALAGKNKADIDSFRNAIFMGIDIYRNRISYREDHKNPIIKKKKR